MTFKEHFNLAEDIIYVNTPGNGLLPKISQAWRNKREQDFFDVHSDLRDKQPEFLAEVKSTVAHFFTSIKDNTFLTPNFSFGYSTLIDLLPKNLRYLLLEEEYPSLQYPLVNRKLAFETIQPSANVEESIREAIRKHQPDVFVLSLVQYISGLKIDMAFLKELKQEFPDLLILADGTQYIGTEHFDFSVSGIDALAGSGYKWLLSGFGNGYLLLSEQLSHFLNENLADIPLPTVAMWKDKKRLHTFFEPGHVDTLSHGTMQQSMQFLQEIGLNQVAQHNRELYQVAYQLLEERKMILPMIAERKIKSPLINIQVNPDYYPHLLNSGIKCFPRGTGIRIGLHLYNDVVDVEHLINVLESIR